MDLDPTGFLLGLPIAFVLGWLASRLDLRQMRIDNRRSPKAYFKGLNHLLNEQQDAAIDAFIEAVQQDPDTSELHFALGNLFRRRGEYHRAVRVHEHLLSRGDLSQYEHERALYALAMDFLQAGLLDRAEQALDRLQESAFKHEALGALLAIYERTRDWPRAKTTARALQAGGRGDFSTRIAHYLCEQAQQSAPAEREALLREAMALSPESGRAYIAWAAMAREAGQPQEVLARLMLLLDHAPAASPLVAQELADLALTTGQTRPVQERLRAAYQATRSLDVVQALATLEPSPEAADALRRSYLQTEPSLVIASKLLQACAVPPEIARALDKASAPLLRYRCASCGFEASQHFWQCPGCQSWDSYSPRRVEEIQHP